MVTHHMVYNKKFLLKKTDQKTKAKNLMIEQINYSKSYMSN